MSRPPVVALMLVPASPALAHHEAAVVSGTLILWPVLASAMATLGLYLRRRRLKQDKTK